MNSENLETFLEIVKTHSLTKTAEHMFVSQSTVSNRLYNLENELNVKLVERSPGQKGINLTQKGVEFMDFARRYLELGQQVQNWSSGTSQEVLKLSSVVSLNDYVLKGFYIHLLSKREISLVLSTHWTDRIISMLENREIDIGITPRVFYSKAIEVSPVFEEPLFLVSNQAVSNYPDLVDPTRLKRANEIYFDWGHKFVDWHDQQISSREPPLMVTDTTAIIAQLLHIPNTFSIIPRSMFRQLNDPDLKMSRIDPAPPHRMCYLLKSKEAHGEKLKMVQYFEQELRMYIREQEDFFSR
ncbi:MAG: LysR family transcriptional regulator [Oscillospiraceae bacterium]|nr:LysR family transcriptional regulator [Oscillospiraceae bacterium]